MPTLQDLMAGIRGGLDGVTAGTQRYPAALMMLAIDKLVGADAGPGGGKMSYADALQAIRDLEAGDVENNPKARLAGQIVGGLATAPIAGGATVARSALNAGILGATSGFTQNAGMDGALRDTAVGAGLGTVLGGVAGGVQKGANALVGHVTSKWADDVASRFEPAQKAAREVFDKLVKYKGSASDKVEEILSGYGRAKPEQIAAAKALNDAHNASGHWTELGQLARGEEIFAEYSVAGRVLNPQEVRAMANRDVSGMLASEDMSLLRGMLKPTLASAATGAAIGGTGAAIMGQDPLQAAMWGAGTTGGAQALRQQLGLVGGRLLVAGTAHVPQGAPLTVARAATRAGVAPAQELVRPQPIEQVTFEEAASPDVELAPWARPVGKVEKAPWER